MPLHLGHGRLQLEADRVYSSPYFAFPQAEVEVDYPLSLASSQIEVKPMQTTLHPSPPHFLISPFIAVP